LTKGHRIGEFEILALLGRGGMGIVYRARHRLLKRLVALKMILTGSAACREERDRFRIEIEAAARLQHPNIVQVFEVGDQDGRPYYAMEHASGGSLAQILDGAPQATRWSAALVETLARAMHAAHQQGVVHRDLKPANILFAADGTPKVSDFGLAKISADGSSNSQSGRVVGTPSYMAPEQAVAGKAYVGPLADVYALGAVLYELLTGRPPFRGETPLETLGLVLTADPVAPTRFQPRLARDVETICLKCLRKDPERRYPSALALAEDLRRFLGDRPILARRASLGERLGRWCRRNPAVAGLSLVLAAMGVLVCVGSVIAALFLGRAAEQARSAERNTEEQLFDSLLVQARANRSSQRPGQRVKSLQAIAQASRLGRDLARGPGELTKLRNEAIACLALPELATEAEWDGNPPGTNGLGFDASFTRYAWSFLGEGIRVRRLADHGDLFCLPTPPSDRVSRWVLLGFSPDGRYLAAYYVQWAQEHPLEVWDLGDGVGRRIITVREATGLPGFATDGRSMMALVPNGEVAVIDLPSGRELRRFQSGGPADALALQPGGNLVAVAGGQTNGVRVLNPETGVVAQRLPHPDAVQGLAWSADGKMLAAACNDLRIHLWDTVRWQEVGQLTGHRFEVGDVAFDPTGKWLASFGWDMTLRVWEVGSRRQVLNVEDVRVLGFRSQGGLAAGGLSGQRVQVWALRPSEVFEEQHLFPTDYPNIDFSPDDRWLTTMGGPETEWRVWDLATLRVVHSQSGRHWSWSPDHAWILSQEADGFSRVSVEVSPGGNGQSPGFRFGEPRHLTGLKEDVRNQFAYWVGPEGRRLLLVDPTGGTPRSRVRLLEIDAATVRVLWEDSKINANSAVVSRDGRLVAVGSYRGGNGITVWETATGRLLRELPVGDAHMAFAGDGKRLYTTTGRLSPRGVECCSWWVDSWEVDRAVPLKRVSHSPAQLSVAADGTLAVIGTTSDVHLLDPETLEEIMTLSAPRPEVLRGVNFSPDQATLIASASGTLHVWKLRRLYQELAGLGLSEQRLTKTTSRP
jgi:WD40 repeat protein